MKTNGKKNANGKKKMLHLADFFCGAGGFTQGFVQANDVQSIVTYKPVLALDNDEASCETYRANFGDHALWCDIENVSVEPRRGGQLLWKFKDKSSKSGEMITPHVDVIIGGPPCQGFSQLGDRDPNDVRNRLWRFYMNLVEIIRPSVFIIENVPQMLSSKEFPQFLEWLTAEAHDYHLTYGVLSASNYSVPQNRKRAFIIASKHFVPAFPTRHERKVSVRHAFKGLPLKPDGKNWHIGRSPTKMSLERYKCVPEGGNRFDLQERRPDLTPDCWRNKATGSTDLFGRLSWDEPARCTIRTEFFKPEKGRYLHPQAHRPITHREAARLQTFPDDFKFQGSKLNVAKQIGNAVPCKLGEAIAVALAHQLVEANGKARGQHLGQQRIINHNNQLTLVF